MVKDFNGGDGTGKRLHSAGDAVGEENMHVPMDNFRSCESIFIFFGLC